MSKGSRTAYGGRIIAGSNPASRISRNSSVVERWGCFSISRRFDSCFLHNISERYEINLLKSAILKRGENKPYYDILISRVFVNV